MSDATIQSESPFKPPDRDRMRRKVFAVLNEAGLDTRADRCDLASFILGRRIRSFTELDNPDWSRLVDALSGWVGVRELRRQRGHE